MEKDIRWNPPWPPPVPETPPAPAEAEEAPWTGLNVRLNADGSVNVTRLGDAATGFRTFTHGDPMAELWRTVLAAG